MRIGIILHGPEIVDTGSAKRIIGLLKQEHEVTAKLGGTMGRTAVLDAGLEDIIDISQGLTPSETITALKDRIDVAVLLNQGKTLETGEQFGCIVASKIDPSIPLIHIESPDLGGRIIYYSPKAREYAEYIKNFLKEHYKRYNLIIERRNTGHLDVRTEGDMVIRRIAGALPGESIRLNGIIIGSIMGTEPEIVCRDGRITELRGGQIKSHGIEKLKKKRIDLFTAKIKTGSIRRTKHRKKIKKTQPQASGKTVAIIDHCAESTFELVKDAGAVITVGDDTTAIAADILSRLGIPVIGITDGDLDRILEDTAVPEGSAIICVKAGFDDIMGREVYDKLMGREQRIRMDGTEELLIRILALAEKHIVKIKYY